MSQRCLVEVLVLVIALLLGAGETDVLGAGEHIVHLHQQDSVLNLFGTAIIWYCTQLALQSFGKALILY